MASDRSILSTGIPQLLLLGVVWGITFPVAHVGVAAGANPILLVGLDFLVAALGMTPVVLLRHSGRPPARSLLQSAGLGALLIAGINLPLYWGLQYATGGAASIVYATSPILSLLALWGFGSRTGLHARQLLALAIGLAGVVVLGVGPSNAALAVGVAALLAFVLGASCQGVGAVLVGRARPHGEGPWGLTFQFLGGAAASFAVLPFLYRAPAFPLSVGTLGSVAYVGVVSMAVGYTLFFRLIATSGAVRANQVTFLNPVVALLVGGVAFGEGFQPIEAVALGLIVLALVLLQPFHRHRVPAAPAPAPGIAGLPGPT